MVSLAHIWQPCLLTQSLQETIDHPARFMAATAHKTIRAIDTEQNQAHLQYTQIPDTRLSIAGLLLTGPFQHIEAQFTTNGVAIQQGGQLEPICQAGQSEYLRLSLRHSLCHAVIHA